MNENKNTGGSLDRQVVILGLRLSKGRPDVCPSYFHETARRMKDMAALGRGEEFTGPFFTRDELFGRLRYVCWVNSNRKVTLYPLWRQMSWKRIHQVAEGRGIVIRENRYVIERQEIESTIS